MSFLERESFIRKIGRRKNRKKKNRKRKI